MFHRDKLPPNAILIEYIPNMRPIDLFNFPKDYLDQLRHILYDDIHQARVLHGDPKPRNMMIASRGEQDSVLRIDFDSARTFSEDGLSPKQEKWVEEAVELMDYFVDGLVGFYDGTLWMWP